MFSEVQPYGRIENLNLMEKDATEISKKTTEHGVARLIDHVLTNNMRSMIELALVRGSIRKFEVVFNSQQGKDMVALSSELEEMKKTIKDCNV